MAGADQSLTRLHRTLAAEARRLRASRERLVAARASLVLPAADEADIRDPATLLAAAIECAAHEQLTQAIAGLDGALAETRGAAVVGAPAPSLRRPPAEPRPHQPQPGGRR